MKIVQNNNRSYEMLGDLINKHIDILRSNRRKNHQKIVEVCHVGKFLLFFNSEITINRLFEQPDFILDFGSNILGLEHQIVVDAKVKEREGFYENIFSIAEAELREDNELPNFLVNCSLSSQLDFKLKQKENLVYLVKSVVKEYVLNDNFMENPLIERISKMKHSQKNVNANFGAWWQKEVTKEIILQAIKKKEKKIKDYQKNCGYRQWLLMVIGSTGESSFEMDNTLKFDIESEFERIYILEDFDNKLYQIK